MKELNNMTKKQLAEGYCDYFYKGRKEYEEFLEMTVKNCTKKELILMVQGARIWTS